MAYKALSEHVKRQKQSHLKHAKMHDMVNMYWHEQGKPIEECKGAHKIAEEHGIKKQWRTIINQYNGGQTAQEAHKAQQKLTPSEEEVLVNFLNESADCGFPQTLHNIENYDFTTKIGVDNQSGVEFQTPTIFDHDWNLIIVQPMDLLKWHK